MLQQKAFRKWTLSGFILNLVFIILALACVLPFVLVLSISVSSESSIIEHGYALMPREFSSAAYQYIALAKETIFSAYGITIAVTVLGAVLSVLVISLYAYPLSRKDFKYRNFFTFFIFFTMLFSGGTVSWYMVCASTLHLKNTIWALILPYAMNAWNVIVMKSFFSSSIPNSIIESAKLDGAGEFRIFARLVMPLSLPGIATIALFSTLTYWNDWWLPLMFITDPKLQNLQFLLQNMISKIQMLNENSGHMGNSTELLSKVPAEGARMALCVIAAGPILLVYPFFQKYFIQGLTVGAIKG